MVVSLDCDAGLSLDTVPGEESEVLDLAVLSLFDNEDVATGPEIDSELVLTGVLSSESESSVAPL